MAESAVSIATAERASRPQSRAAPACAAALLLLMALLSGAAASRESVTVDEVAHIGAGVSYLQRLDLRLNEEHPPLAKVIAAIPLVLRGTRADYSHEAWKVSDNFFASFMGEWVFGETLLQRWNDPATTLAWARLPMMLLMVALGWVLFLYARQLGGDWAGILCTCMYTSSAVFLTFGPLVITDVALTLFSLTTLWALADLWNRPSRKNTVVLGAWLAAALLTKFSSGLLLVTFLAFAIVARYRPLALQPSDAQDRRRWLLERRRAVARSVLIAAGLVYIVYFLLSVRQSTDALNELWHSAAWIPVRRLLMPPWLYLRGLFLFAMTAVRPTFILGRGYARGVWFYFPVLFVFKSSLGFLALLAGTAGMRLLTAVHGDRTSTVDSSHSTHWRTIWVALAVFTVACMLSPMAISFRHFMMPVVLAILLLAPLPRLIAAMRHSTLRRATAGLVMALAFSSVVTSARTYPHYMPYLNALASGRPAYWWMSDSNLDWNQTLPEVRAFAQRRGLTRVAVDFYGLTDPADTVPGARLWDCQEMPPSDAGQWVFVSANMILDAHNCAWLMSYPREALGGGSMYAVRLPTRIPPPGTTGGPPPPADWKQFGGDTFPGDIREVYLNVYRHPEKIATIVAEMQKTYEDAQKQRAK